MSRTTLGLTAASPEEFVTKLAGRDNVEYIIPLLPKNWKELDAGTLTCKVLDALSWQI